MNKLTKLIKEQREEWNSSDTFLRIDSTESFYRTHGAPEYKGMTVPEVMDTNTTALLEEVIKMVEENMFIPPESLAITMSDAKRGYNAASDTIKQSLQEAIDNNKE